MRIAVLICLVQSAPAISSSFNLAHYGIFDTDVFGTIKDATERLQDCSPALEDGADSFWALRTDNGDVKILCQNEPIHILSNKYLNGRTGVLRRQNGSDRYSLLFEVPDNQDNSIEIFLGESTLPEHARLPPASPEGILVRARNVGFKPNTDINRLLDVLEISQRRGMILESRLRDSLKESYDYLVKQRTRNSLTNSFISALGSPELIDQLWSK